MPVNEQLVDRIRELIAQVTSKVEEKRMFSGICLMVNGKMCIAVSSDRIMVRFDPARTEEILEKEGTRAMVMSGRALDGFVYVDESVLGTKQQLGYWVRLALDYNPLAKSSKKAGPGKKVSGAAKKAATGKKVSGAAKKAATRKKAKKAGPAAAGKKAGPARKSR